MLSPFVWLVARRSRTSEALNEYVFFPPLSKWSETMNLDNFRQLLRGPPEHPRTGLLLGVLLQFDRPRHRDTTLQMLFCSMGGYALAKYEFRGKAALTLSCSGR